MGDVPYGWKDRLRGFVWLLHHKKVVAKGCLIIDVRAWQERFSELQISYCQEHSFYLNFHTWYFKYEIGIGGIRILQLVRTTQFWFAIYQPEKTLDKFFIWK